MPHKALSAALFVAFMLTNSAWGATNPFAAKLDQEEKTWHKFFVFWNIASATGVDQQAALEWLRDRIDSGKARDSRYAVTYSQLLWQSKLPERMDDALFFSMVGYLTLQLESARCETRNESLQVARLWYDPVRPQLIHYRAMKREEKDRIFQKALEYVDRVSLAPATDADPGADWMCYLMPSYTEKISKLPDVITERRTQGSLTIYFHSHPSVKPTISSEQQFSARRKKIVEDMKVF